MKYILTLLLTLLLSSACEEKKQVDAKPLFQGKSYSIELTQAPADFPLNELFEFTFKVKPEVKNISIKVDAGMPSHGHGMNTVSKTDALSPGHYKVRGMKLHMEGEWVLSFEIYEKDKLLERIEHTFTL